jgi:hypothetical protein
MLYSLGTFFLGFEGVELCVFFHKSFNYCSVSIRSFGLYSNLFVCEGFNFVLLKKQFGQAIVEGGMAISLTKIGGGFGLTPAVSD